MKAMSDETEADMKRSDFRIDCEFRTASGWWRCTDVGTRTIAAIRLDLDHDPIWYDGPPYGVASREAIRELPEMTPTGSRSLSTGSAKAALQ